jgi:hypothetical protein
MKKLLQKNLALAHRLWLGLILSFTVGLCLAQEEVDTYNYQVSETKTKEKGHHWGVAVTMFTGRGNFAGDLRKEYRAYIPIGVSVDVYYRNFALYLGMFGGYGKTRKDIRYDTAVWEKGDWYELLQADLSLGYIVDNNETYKLAPFASISFLDFGPATELFFLPDDEASPWDDVDFGKATFLSLGVNFDVKVDYREKDPSTLWSLRLKYAYNFPIAGLGRNSADGSMHSFTIGINYLFIEQK